jgi:nephrocystin-3
MEIMHGVLSNEVTAARALFFERDPAWNWIADLTPEEQASVAVESDADRAKLTELKAAIRAKINRVRSYKTPDALGPAVREALGAAIESEFPEIDASDAFEQDLRLHRAYSRERRGLHVGAGLYRTALDEWMRGPDNSPLLVTGASGGGKSTLIANWAHSRREANPRDIVFEHYLGASPDSADPRLLIRRLWEYLNRATGEIVELPAGDVELMALSKSLGLRIDAASEFVEREGAKIVIALDGLDKLSSGQDLAMVAQNAACKVAGLKSRR